MLVGSETLPQQSKHALRNRGGRVAEESRFGFDQENVLERAVSQENEEADTGLDE